MIQEFAQRVAAPVLIAAFGLTGTHSPGAERPNILFITLDDMNRDSVGVYGSRVPDTTPNIDRLAAEGLRFEHGHVTVAICQPTRAVWMTGRYPHNNGALGFDPIRPGIATLPETLRANGYLTGILGKTEHVIPTRKTAFDFRRSQRELLVGRSAELYAQSAADFFGRVDESGQPFFLMVNTHDPHRPFDNRKPAAQRRPGTVSETTQSGKPRLKKRRFIGDYPAPSRIYEPHEVAIPGFLPDLPAIREELAQYYSSVRRADDVVGQVLDELDRAGFRDNTLVMLKSDHGIAVPFAKTNVWRHSTRVPWIVRWPGVIRPGTHDTEHVVAGIDVTPTILDVASVSPIEHMDGRSLLPVFKGESQADRDFVFTHINTIASKRDYTMRSVQGKRFGLIWNAWSDGRTAFRNESMAGLTWKAMTEAAKSNSDIAARVRHFRHRVPFEFYDYEEDPDALRNLIDSPDHQQTIAEFRARLIESMTSTGDPAAKRFPAD